MASLVGVRGLLLDLDGTVYEDDTPIPGVAAALAALRRRGIALRFVTNTTRMPASALRERLVGFGVAADADEILNAPRAAASWLCARGIERVAAYVTPATVEELGGLTLDDTRPQAIVVGDLGEDWTFDRLNRAFVQVLAGAEIVALQKNRYWKTARGLTLDAGPFVAALEYATGRPATVVGKPSREFFEAAARSTGVPFERVAVVGDDLVTDVGGAQAAGFRGILVRTGKFREEDLARSEVRPAAVIGSVAELPDLLGYGPTRT